MDIINIIKDLCMKYPAFAKQDAKIQVMPHSPTSIHFYYKGREFFYDVTVGILELLPKGSIASIYAPITEDEEENDKE